MIESTLRPAPVRGAEPELTKRMEVRMAEPSLPRNSSKKHAPLAERFARYVGEPGENGCILWTGSVNKRGYGQIQLAGRGGRPVLAHRLSWELANGPMASGMCVLHRCDVPGCVNPAHLFLGTRADNQRDMAIKGRGTLSATGLFGVSQRRQRFIAQITVAGRRLYLGSFDTAEEASAAVVAARGYYYGVSP